MIINNITVEGDAKIANFVLPATTITRTTNGTVNLNNTDNSAQLVQGDNTGFSLVMPDATTLPQGHKYEIYNVGNTTMLVKSYDISSPATLLTLSQTSTAYLYLQDNSTPAGLWLCWQIISTPDVASGILNYKITSSTVFSTTSATDVQITGFSLTPQAGTYAAWFNARAKSSNGSADNTWSFYKAGTQIVDSVRGQRAGGANANFALSTMTTIQVDGSQSIDVRVARSGGTLSVYDRTMTLIRLGN